MTSEPRPARPRAEIMRRTAAFAGGLLGLSSLLAASPELPPLTAVPGSPRLPGKFV